MKTMPYPTDLDSFMKELLYAFHNERTVEAYRDQLAKVKRASSMDLETYGYYLLDLARKAHPLAVAHEQERIARECFFETAGSCDLHVWLIARGPKTMKDTIDQAIEYEQAIVVHAARRPSVPLPMQVSSKSATADIEEQLRGMIADLRDLKDQMRFGSHKSAGKHHCKCCDCPKSRHAVQQMKSLGHEVKALGEKVNYPISQVKPRLSGLGDRDVATISCKPGKQRQYTCSVCPKAFNAKRRLKAHLDTAHASSFWGYECPKVGCVRTFHPVHRGLLKAHLRVGHDCCTADINRIMQAVELKIVANVCSEHKGAYAGPVFNMDSNSCLAKEEDPSPRSRKRKRRRSNGKRICRPKSATAEQPKVVPIVKTAIGHPGTTGEIIFVNDSEGTGRKIQEDHQPLRMDPVSRWMSDWGGGHS